MDARITSTISGQGLTEQAKCPGVGRIFRDVSVYSANLQANGSTVTFPGKTTLYACLIYRTPTANEANDSVAIEFACAGATFSIYGGGWFVMTWRDGTDLGDFELSLTSDNQSLSAFYVIVTD